MSIAKLLIAIFLFIFIYPCPVQSDNVNNIERDIAEQLFIYIIDKKCSFYGKEKFYAFEVRNSYIDDDFLRKLSSLFPGAKRGKDVAASEEAYCMDIAVHIEEISKDIAVATGICSHRSHGFGSYASYKLSLQNGKWVVIEVFHVGEGD